MAKELKTLDDWHAEVPCSPRKPIILGFSILFFAFFGFGHWASTAPIAGAKVTSGSFMAAGQNKIIQHLEGGIIKEILVNEGDIVEQGQVMIRLDEVGPLTELRRLTVRRTRLEAMQARLQAESQEARDWVVPESLLRHGSDPEVTRILTSQQMTFAARQNSLLSTIATIERAIAGLEQRITGGQQQLAAVRDQLGFINEELEGKNELYRKELITKPQVLALERARAGLEGEIGRLTAEIGDAQERIARAREQIVSVRNDAIEAAVSDLERVSSELDDVQERILHAETVLQRINIIAPVRGVVVQLAYHTPGGVIVTGSKVMEILPLEGDLVIQARVQPSDIDQIHLGQSATVRLTALSQRITPMVEGEVTYVSADVVSDQYSTAGPRDIYIVRVKLDPVEAAKVPGFQPTPGMPVEVYIKTEERTFLEYLLRPLKDSMQRAFRET